MCKYQTRVHSCGHYEKTLLQPCDDAKKAEKVCSSGSEDSKTTGGLCYISGCDKKPGGRREGPGKLIIWQSQGNTNIKTDDRTDGGFNPDDIDWSAF